MHATTAPPPLPLPKSSRKYGDWFLRVSVLEQYTLRWWCVLCSFYIRWMYMYIHVSLQVPTSAGVGGVGEVDGWSNGSSHHNSPRYSPDPNYPQDMVSDRLPQLHMLCGYQSTWNHWGIPPITKSKLGAWIFRKGVGGGLGKSHLVCTQSQL